MDLFIGTVIIGVLVAQAYMFAVIMTRLTPTRDTPVRHPEYNRRRCRRTPPGGYVSMEDTIIKVKEEDKK